MDCFKERISAVLMIVMLSSACWLMRTTEGTDKILGPPSREGELEMRMIISDASISSFLGENIGDRSGNSVSGVGDVNGDGFDDVLIGAPQNQEGGAYAGQTYLIFGKNLGFEMDMNISSADASFIGEASNDVSGWSTSGAGDVNGDGFDDFLIGADLNDEGGSGAGQTYLFFGKDKGWTKDTILSSANASFIGEGASDESGISVSGAGDVNGDGFDDILIGSFMNNEGGTDSGQTYLIFGKSTGWDMDTNLGETDASFIGEVAFDRSGNSVSGAGDVNGDGYDDIIIGAYSNEEGGNNAGQTYIVFGRSTGWSMDMALSSANASFIGEAGGDSSGNSVSGAGDVNEDGFDDILIGASENDEGSNRAGQTYLILGKPSGWAMDTDLGSVDASFLGEDIGLSGNSVSGAGDMNGDGFDDILIGAYCESENGGEAGQIYLILGKGSGWSMDMNLGIISYASFLGEDSSDLAGISVSEAGDINGDGCPEILIGASWDEEAGEQSGQTYLISGSDYSEPIKIYDIRVQNALGDQTYKADILEIIQVEMTGLDSNITRIDRARVNVTFSRSIPSQITFSLVETGENTGLYKGTFMVPVRALYYEKMRFSAYIDQSKYYNVVVDYPFRPSSITSVGVYSSSSSTSMIDKLDFGQTGYFKCTGLDSNPITVDKAFVNLSSDKNSSFDPSVFLTETGLSTGIYMLEFTVPETMEYFENITLTSVETPARTAKFMVHTPVQVRAEGSYQTALEDFEYSAGFYNFGYNTATWTVTTDAHWLSWDNTNKEVYGTPRNNDVGKYLWNVMVLLEDSFGNSHDMNYPLSVLNTPPKITTEPITEWTEKKEYVLDIDSDDDDQGDISWYLNTNAPFLTIEKNTGVVRGAPIEGDEGIYFVNVQVQDGNGGSDNLVFNLTVLGMNDRPSITTTDIKQIEQDTPFRRDYDVFDPDEGDTHHWTLRTDAEWLSMENDTGVLFGTPDGYDVGDWLVNITVTDNGGLSDSREFILKVLDKKDKPIWLDVPTDIELLHGTDYYFDANATDPDIGNVLIYSIETETECDMRINSKTGEIGWTANYRCMPKTSGIQVMLKVSDGELFSIHEFTITVTPTQSPSVAIISPSKGSRTPSTSTKLEWEGSDPENEPLYYTLYLADSESYVMAKREDDIRETSIIGSNYTLTGLIQGKTYYWTVVPDDGCTSGRCTNGVFSFRVNNRPVLKEVLAQDAESGKEFNLKLEGSDSDQDDKLTYSILSGPDGMTVRSETGMIVWTPKDGQTGIQKVRVRVTDGYESVERSFEVEVTEGSALDMGLVIGIGIGLLILIIIILLIYIFVIKGKSTEKEDEDEEAKRIQEEIEQHQKELEWEEAHTKGSDHTVVSDVPISSVEAHAHDHDNKPKSYEELYGEKIPEEEE